MFITFESVDGVGKTTQVKLLTEYFRGDKRLEEVYVTKEPGDINNGSNIGAGLRDLLFKNPTAKAMATGVADLLFLADHMQNSHEIQQKLNAGYHVISDRYADSQFAYSRGKTKKAPKWTLDLYEEQYGVIPDIIIFLYATNIETGWTLDRANARKGIEAGKQDGKPWNSIEEQMFIQQGYVNRFIGQGNIITIEVSKETSVEALHQSIVNLVEKWTEKNGESC